MREPQRFDRAGLLALAPRAWGGIFDVGPTQQAYREEGGCAIVSVCGPLVQQPGWWFESYGEVRARVAAALASKAPVVILELDSPGGEVGGCFETARDLRALADQAKKPFIAYVNGAAASAAYALACACDRIVAPDTALVGSVGVIDALVDVTKRNELDGVRVAVITSGKRKADGDPDVPLSSEAIAARQEIVNRLAATFFGWVSERRGITPEQVASYEGGVVDGAMAKQLRLVDDVQRMSELLASVGNTNKAVARAAARAKGKPHMAMSYEEVLAELATLAAGEGDDAAKAKDALSKITAAPPADPAEPDQDDQQKQESAAAIAAVLRETGTSTVTDALAAVARHRASHAKLEAEQTRLAAEQAALDATKRRDLVAKMVVLGRETPATAWAPGADGLPDGKTPAEPWASMALPALEARVKAMGGAPRASAQESPAAAPTETSEGDKVVTVNGQPVIVTPREQKACAEKGLAIEAYAKKKLESGLK